MAHSSSYGLGPHTSRQGPRSWLLHAKCNISTRSDMRYNAQCMSSLAQYSRWQPQPHLHPLVYGQQTRPFHARYWGPARCGHHPFSDGRSARHGNITSLPPRRLCASGSDSLEHTLLSCTTHHSARQRWLQHTSGTCPLSMLQLFGTNVYISTARGIARNISYVAHVCQAAEACEI